MEEPKNKCVDCGSEEVFITWKSKYSETEEDIFQCFDCYCQAYENYIHIDNNDDEDYM